MSSWASFSSQIKKRKDGAAGEDDGSRGSSSAVVKRAKEGNPALGASSSFLGLKAELAGRKGGSSSSTSSSREYLEKKQRKLPAHLRPAPDVLARSAKHDQRDRSSTTTSSWANTPSAQLEATRRHLERKAAMYEKLKRGGTGGLDEQSFQESLIDWDRKGYHHSDNSEGSGSSDQEGEGQGQGRERHVDSDEDPLTEYEDDLGRMRKVRRSQVPRSALRAKQQREEEGEGVDEEMVSYGASTSFPVFKPDADDRRRPEAERANGYARQRADHFDADFEKRYRGAGFYQFSQDEATRREQMEALRADRDQTERARQQLQGADGTDKGLSKAEQRLEDRRRLVNAKRAEIEEKKRRLLGGD